jgi:hypothetical protein
MATANYTFSQPIRYYKANDPYYYEVDNLPLRQLEENILWVKERLEDVDVPEPENDTPQALDYRFLTGNSEISLANIKELKPKLQSGRTIKVNAGKFTARVNDTFDIAKPLTNMILGPGGPGDTTGGINPPVIIPNLLRMWPKIKKIEVWDSFINSMSTGGASYNMNGLEVNYTFYSTPGTMGGTWGWRGYPGHTSAEVGDCIETHPINWGYPFYDFPGEFWNTMTWPQVDAIKALSPGGSNQGTATNANLLWSYETLVNLHQEFVKLWRSPFRTAVVDVPDSTIEIPEFNTDDFRFMEQDLEVSSLEEHATHRIDLLVVYTMSIDSSSTTLNNYSDTICGAPAAPQTINQPILGLVRGAGFGLSRGYIDCFDDPNSINAYNECSEAAGEHGVDVGDPKILGNTNDEDTTANAGITNRLGAKIHGSFPSPDDLLNLAPVLAFNSVDADDLQRIGQTALPLAYIVVKKDTPNITNTDIIDIRPFLRTTEFTYNERAGIAAANPPLSLANPAIGAFQLQDIINQVYNTINGLGGGDAGAGDGDGGAAPTNTGKVLYTDYVMGGLAFGVEGTLLTMNNQGAGASDPWGSITRGATFAGHNFATFTNSKAFLDDTNLNRRNALLNYFYQQRQSDLKLWLSDPNTAVASNGNYLNLAAERNIPVWPEWDPPADLSNYLEALVGQGGGPGANAATWWMWFEGVERARPFRYVPGGVISNTGANANAALAYEYAPGFKGGAAQYAATTQMSSKVLELNLPYWVNDYDVQVQYMNCLPMSYAGDDGEGGDTYEPHLGLQNGLSVNKGPIKEVGGIKTAIIAINSAGQSVAATNGNSSTEGMIKVSNGTINDNLLLCPVASQPQKFLTYSVILPQFRETNWRTQPQAGGSLSNHLRYTPKTGAAYYPTVKFTIVGYGENNQIYNTELNSNGTLIPQTAAGGSPATVDTFGPPIYGISKVDITSIQ